MSRNCRIPVGEYDILRLFGSIPASVDVSVRAELDGTWRELGKKRGIDTTGEFDFFFSGKGPYRCRNDL
jgi:Holliday junction resolvase-like predicted endonuclease